ncbi:MAG: methyltransferase domain-containing protein [Bacteroidota bacterium]
MKKWVQKAIVQKTISYLPFSDKLNFFFQKHITRGVNLTNEFFTDRIGHAAEHLKAYKKLTGKEVPESCLEIGTGWYPIVPVSFFLAGSDAVFSVDIAFHTTKERIRATLEKMVEAGHSGRLEACFRYSPERFEIIENLLRDYDRLSLSDVLRKMNFTCLVEDARSLSLPDNSIDLINSNNTFEHIYPDILIPILREFKRVARQEGGAMSHFIDMSDHFAHFDKSISIYNFLKFSDRQWKWIDNSVQPQNRMRIYEYRNIYSDLSIPCTLESFREGNREQLSLIRLSDRFKNNSPEETAISHCHFISATSFFR